MERQINFRAYFEKSADCILYVSTQTDGRLGLSMVIAMMKELGGGSRR